LDTGISVHLSTAAGPCSDQIQAGWTKFCGPDRGHEAFRRWRPWHHRANVNRAHRLPTVLRDAFFPDWAALRDIALVGLLLFVVISPFLQGTGASENRPAIGGGAAMPLGILTVEVSAFLVMAATFLSGVRLSTLRSMRTPLIALGAIACVGILQLLPLPTFLLARFCPVNFEIYHSYANILGLLGRPVPSAARISIAPSDTLDTVLLTLAYGALFLSSATLLQTRGRRRLFLLTVFATACGQIVWAAAREGTSDRLHGPFFNPNHFAGYLEIVLALAFGALWTEVLTNSDRVREITSPAEALEKRLPPFAVRVLLWAVVAVGIGLTGSRGGLFSAALTTVVLLFLSVLDPRLKFRRRAAMAVAIAVTVGAAFFVLTTGSTPFVRFLDIDPRDLASDTRVSLWKTAIAAWRQFPIFGSGLGTFREAFRRVQPRELTGLVEQAHSDSLQLLVTGGAVGAAFGVLLFASLFWLLLRAWRNQPHREERALTLAGFGALLSLTLHGLLDFNLSIPAIPALLSCVLGAAWAAGRTR
jgi:O-antigen ligase